MVAGRLDSGPRPIEAAETRRIFILVVVNWLFCHNGVTTTLAISA